MKLELLPSEAFTIHTEDSIFKRLISEGSKDCQKTIDQNIFGPVIVRRK